MHTYGRPRGLVGVHVNLPSTFQVMHSIPVELSLPSRFRSWKNWTRFLLISLVNNASVR